MPIDNQPAYPAVGLTTSSQPEIIVPPSITVPTDPNNPPWGLGGAMVVLFGSIFLQILFSILFFVPYLLILAASPNRPENLAEFALTDKTAIFLQVIAILPAHLFSLALVWAVVTRFGKRSFVDSLGLNWSGQLWFWGSVGLGVVLFGVAGLLAWLVGAGKPTQLDQIINSSLAARYSLAALAVFTAPLVEELVYRGVLYSALQRLVGVSPAVIIVLGIFTLIHVPQYWPNVGVLAAVGLLSVSLTIIRAYTGRLLPCVVIHFVFNGIQAIYLVVEPHLPKLSQSVEQAPGMLLLLHCLL